MLFLLPRPIQGLPTVYRPKAKGGGPSSAERCHFLLPLFAMLMGFNYSYSHIILECAGLSAWDKIPSGRRFSTHLPPFPAVTHFEKPSLIFPTHQSGWAQGTSLGSKKICARSSVFHCRVNLFSCTSAFSLCWRRTVFGGQLMIYVCVFIGIIVTGSRIPPAREYQDCYNSCKSRRI